MPADRAPDVTALVETDYWARPLADRLRGRARVAREEGNATAIGDAVHFNEAAREIDRLSEEESKLLAILRECVDAWDRHYPKLPVDEAAEDDEFGAFYRARAALRAHAARGGVDAP